MMGLIFSIAILWLAGGYSALHLLNGRLRMAAVSFAIVLTGFTVLVAQQSHSTPAAASTYLVAYPESFYHHSKTCPILKRSLRPDNRLEVTNVEESCLSPCPYCNHQNLASQ